MHQTYTEKKKTLLQAKSTFIPLGLFVFFFCLKQAFIHLTVDEMGERKKHITVMLLKTGCWSGIKHLFSHRHWLITSSWIKKNALINSLSADGMSKTPGETSVCGHSHSSKKVKLVFGIFTLWYEIRLKTWRAKFSLRHAVHDWCMYIKTRTYITHMLTILVRTFKGEGKDVLYNLGIEGGNSLAFWEISLFVFRSEVCHMMRRINTKCFCAD